MTEAANAVAPDRDYEDIAVGEEAAIEIDVSHSMVARFAALTGDRNPLHMDDEYARTTPLAGRIVHGMLTASFVSTLIGMHLPGRRALIQSVEVQFVTPVRIGDRLRLEGRVKEKHDAFRCLIIVLRARRQDDTLVARGTVQVSTIARLGSEQASIASAAARHASADQT